MIGLKTVPAEERNISFVFQDVGLWPHMSVKDHLKFVLRNKGSKGMDAEIKGLLEVVGLEGNLDSKPSELSGGEKQRLAISRAMSQKSDIVLFDEPLSSLDIHLKKEITTLLKTLRKEYNLTMVYVTHNIFDLTDMCKRVGLIENGKISRIENAKSIFKRQLPLFMG